MTEEENNAWKNPARNGVADIASWFVLVILVIFLGVAS